MAYLKTVLTYHLPSEAEVDKAFLESHGLTVCLLNGNTSRNELGAPFFIQLQVADEEHAEAVRLLREANPGRFGSQTVVNDLDRLIKRTLGLFFLGAIAAGVLLFYVTPGPELARDEYGYAHFGPDPRPFVAFFGGLAGGFLALRLGRKSKKPGVPPASS